MRRSFIEGMETVLIRLAEKRFGDLGEKLEQQIRALSVKQLEKLTLALLDFSSLADLKSWLVAQK